MNDRPQLLRPKRHVSSHSPTRLRAPGPSIRDDFLRQLGPSAAVESLTYPTGPLKSCLDEASASERDFAMRTAVASNMIWGWVQELTEWAWPNAAGSAGFEEPSLQNTGDHYIGSLPSADIDMFEARIDQIQREMTELEVEDIKSHVMTEHIMPLSRPGTPMSAMSCGTSSSVGFYNKMEDLSAVITAIVVQTLPNLAKLSKLLQTWSIRLRVLERIPRLLRAIEDAEVALTSGWNAIAAPKETTTHSRQASLSREHFQVMKNVIEKKVSAGGRTADYMLDCLEGQPDTLPNDWLDRLEKVETDYAEWVSACERRVYATEWGQQPKEMHPAEPNARTEESEIREDIRPAPKAQSPPIVISEPGDSRTAPLQSETNFGTLSQTLDGHEPERHDVEDSQSDEPEEDSSVIVHTPEYDESTQYEPEAESSIIINTIEQEESMQSDPRDESCMILDTTEQDESQQYEPEEVSSLDSRTPSEQREPRHDSSSAARIYESTAASRAKRNSTKVPAKSANNQVAAMVRRLEEKAQEYSAAQQESNRLRALSLSKKSAAANQARKPHDPTQSVDRSSRRGHNVKSATGFDGAGHDVPQGGALASALPIVSSAVPKEVSALIESDDENDGAVDDEDSELPPLPNDTRRNSDASDTSVVIHGASSRFDLSSDLPEISASPGISRIKVRQARYVTESPPSSPPLPEDRAPESPEQDSDHTTETTSTAKQHVSHYDRAPSMEPVYEDEDLTQDFSQTPLEGSFVDDYDDSFSVTEFASPIQRKQSVGDDQLRQQISQIIQDIPAKIKLTNETPNVNLNPPDLKLPKMRKKPSLDRFRRSGSAMSTSAMSTRSTVSSRAGTPAFTLSPAKNTRARANRGQQEIKVYHLSRSTGEAPIKLFIRCVGESGERVMVRVGGGWADLSEYLKEYASHHKRRSAATDNPKVEVNLPRNVSGKGNGVGSSPPSRPGSVLESPMTPLNVRKPRRSSGAYGNEVPRLLPKTPSALNSSLGDLGAIPQSEDSTRSRSSSRLSWVEDDSSFLGLAGPSGKRVEMSEENKAWVESVKQKVRLASGELRSQPSLEDQNKGRFGELGKVGGTKRLFRKGDELKKY